MTTSAPSSLSVLDLFSGIGGFSYAAEQLVGGFKTIAFCDSDEPCRKVLRKHWPDTPVFTDVRSIQAEDIQPLCPDGLSLITAGFPCQDLSVAGKQAGYNGERSVLFYEIIRLARELRPDFLLLENVRNLLSHQNGETFQETLFQIAKAGYDAEWAVIPASDLGACHKRERIWIVAHANSGRQLESGLFLSAEERSSDGLESIAMRSSRSGESSDYAAHADNSRLEGREPASMLQHPSQWSARAGNSPSARLSPKWTSYVSSPVLCRGDDGLSNRVDRLKQLGNSIVPQVAAVPLRRIKELAAPRPEHNGSL
jgi:DNA (cytosine-5)-methyltransferase 1